MCGVCDFVDRMIKHSFVRMGRFRKSAELSDELERRGTDFIIGRGRSEIMQGSNVSAHGSHLTADSARSPVSDLLANLNSATTVSSKGAEGDWRHENGDSEHRGGLDAYCCHSLGI
jgi:hypothetical protein